MPGTITDEQLRAEVSGWLAQHWDPALSRRDWLALVVAARWAVPSWPAQWGGRELPGRTRWRPAA